MNDEFKGLMNVYPKILREVSMRAKCFTNKEVSELKKNKYTAFVSNHSIRFTLEFKQLFLQMRAGYGVQAYFSGAWL